MRNYLSKPAAKPSGKQTIDLEMLYEHTHEELTLQQSKRDQLITLYLAMISFIVPFAFSLSSIPNEAKGVLFAFLSLIGILFAAIAVRYRIYKECYWLSCQTLACLKSYEPQDINEQLVKYLFYQAMEQKYRKYVCYEKQKIFRFKLCKSAFFSAETLYYVAHTLMVAIATALSIIFFFSYSTLGILVALPSALLVGAFVLHMYFKNLTGVFETLKYAACPAEDEVANAKADQCFHAAFAKAWTLHFYPKD